jgi:hypothetical protein
MDTRPVQEAQQSHQTNIVKAIILGIAGLLVPGLGHALQRKWLRAGVFFFSISLMAVLGLQLQGRIYSPEDIFSAQSIFDSIFSFLKFAAEAGAGLLYWIPFLGGSAAGDTKAYTYDYANLFLYVAGLLNMLVVIDAFDISLGRKQ